MPLDKGARGSEAEAKKQENSSRRRVFLYIFVQAVGNVSQVLDCPRLLLIDESDTVNAHCPRITT